jgi:TRAP-type C4-dicarboxylate transport system substrate-binding protein
LKGKFFYKSALLFFVLAIILGYPLITVRSVSAGTQYVIKFATVAPEGSTWLKHMRALVKNIQAISGGKIGFRIYAGGIAGDELDVLKKIRINQIHSAAFSGVGLGQILPKVRVLDLPFLFRKYEEVDRVHHELESFFAEKFRETGFELLAWAEVGNVHLFSKKPIHTMRDLYRLKVWAWSGDPIAKATFAAMGINPIPLSYPDVTTALSTGMIDTVYAPPLAALVLQWYTSLNYMTALPLAHSTGAVLISSRYFQRLPQNLSSLLTSSFKDAMEDLTIDLRNQNKETIQLMRDSGLTVIPTPSRAALEEFYRIHDQIAQGLTGKIYPRETLEKVYGILKRSRSNPHEIYKVHR